MRGIDLDIHKGDFIALFGPSGSGRTTFLNMLTGIDVPSAGAVTVDGVDVVRAGQRKLTRWRRRNIGIVFQFFQLLPTLTVLENVMVPMDFCDVYEPKEAPRAGDGPARAAGHRRPGLQNAGHAPAGSSSAWRLRALANDPPLVVGDEPTGNLDRMSAAVVFEIFHELRERPDRAGGEPRPRDLTDVPG